MRAKNVNFEIQISQIGNHSKRSVSCFQTYNDLKKTLPNLSDNKKRSAQQDAYVPTISARLNLMDDPSGENSQAFVAAERKLHEKLDALASDTAFAELKKRQQEELRSWIGSLKQGQNDRATVLLNTWQMSPHTAQAQSSPIHQLTCFSLMGPLFNIMRRAERAGTAIKWSVPSIIYELTTTSLGGTLEIICDGEKIDIGTSSVAGMAQNIPLLNTKDLYGMIYNGQPEFPRISYDDERLTFVTANTGFFGQIMLGYGDKFLGIDIKYWVGRALGGVASARVHKQCQSMRIKGITGTETRVRTANKYYHTKKAHEKDIAVYAGPSVPVLVEPDSSVGARQTPFKGHTVTKVFLRLNAGYSIELKLSKLNDGQRYNGTQLSCGTIVIHPLDLLSSIRTAILDNVDSVIDAECRQAIKAARWCFIGEAD